MFGLVALSLFSLVVVVSSEGSGWDDTTYSTTQDTRYSTPRPTRWYPRLSSWYPRSTSWRPRSSWWYSTSTPWYPRTTTSPRRSEKAIYCKNYRDMTKELPESGDMTCKAESYIYRYSSYSNPSTNDLILRETVVYDSNLYYSPQYNYRKVIRGSVSEVNILNFGEIHGFVKKITIKDDGYYTTVSAEIEMPPKQEAKLFVEIYGRKS